MATRELRLSSAQVQPAAANAPDIAVADRSRVRPSSRLSAELTGPPRNSNIRRFL